LLYIVHLTYFLANFLFKKCLQLFNCHLYFEGSRQLKEHKLSLLFIAKIWKARYIPIPLNFPTIGKLLETTPTSLPLKFSILKIEFNYWLVAIVTNMLSPFMTNQSTNFEIALISWPNWILQGGSNLWNLRLLATPIDRKFQLHLLCYKIFIWTLAT
jgi:hypothetical protein